MPAPTRDLLIETCSLTHVPLCEDGVALDAALYVTAGAAHAALGACTLPATEAVAFAACALLMAVLAVAVRACAVPDA